MKLDELIAVPAFVVTLIGPLFAPRFTTATITESDWTTKLFAFDPLNFTPFVPVKLLPLIVTLLPLRPCGGEKLEMVGGGGTMNAPTLVPVPPGVVTLIVPLVVPAATTAVILVAELTLNRDAAVP